MIERQLNMLLNNDAYDKNHLHNEREIARLQKLTELLTSLDRWNLHKSNDSVITRFKRRGQGQDKNPVQISFAPVKHCFSSALRTTKCMSCLLLSNINLLN